MHPPFLFSTRRIVLIEGVIFAVLGLLALAWPHFFSLGIELLIGVFFVIGSIWQVVRGIKRPTSHFVIKLVICLIFFFYGLFLIFFPKMGLASLSLVISVVFLIEGLSLMQTSFKLKPRHGWGWFFASSLISLLMAILIWLNWPADSAWIVGLLTGINLLFVGLSCLILSLSTPKSQ